VAAGTYGDPDLFVGVFVALEIRIRSTEVKIPLRCSIISAVYAVSIITPVSHRIYGLCSGGAATRSVPERADEHVRAKHGEGLRVGHHEAM
jgi:hypothetical protein